MKKDFFIFAAVLMLTAATAQQNTKPFKGEFYNREQKISLSIDLYDTTIVAPSYSFLGKLNGYLTGAIYDAWFITTFKIKNNQAKVTFANDLGGDILKVNFSFNEEGDLIYEVEGSNTLRRSEKRKWIKLPNKMIFENKNKKLTKNKQNVPTNPSKQ